MRNKILIQPLVLLFLAHCIETRDETARETTTSEDVVVLPQHQSGNTLNTTEHNPPLQQKNKETLKVDDRYTAGRTSCRADNKCDFHGGVSYKYCYVDYSDNWDYCCTGPCDYHQGTTYLWCESGSKSQYCGNAGNINIDGRTCYYSHPCGMHQEKGKEPFYWCYVDHKLNWNRCCRPGSKCDYHGAAYKWCYTGYQKDTSWYECK
ncbi:hypothetical protein ACJMK2_018253 [Sinanodonta woodiana]|uniref:Uncharacterized protein n=1 Tax=Sinanodonta woodiana TaxID=1069815 RepID=A0ABD3UGS9_SINWO